MMKCLRCAIAALLLCATALATATIHAGKPGAIYDKAIFTPFAEHPGNGILTAPAITSHITFRGPETVKPVALTGAQIDVGTLTVTLPTKLAAIVDLQ
jgi:hypothetical protein